MGWSHVHELANRIAYKTALNFIHIYFAGFSSKFGLNLVHSLIVSPQTLFSATKSGSTCMGKASVWMIYSVSAIGRGEP